MFASLPGVSLYGGPKASSLLMIPEARTFRHEYSSLACTVEVVEDVYAAIDHIHQHGRHVMFAYFFTRMHYDYFFKNYFILKLRFHANFCNPYFVIPNSLQCPHR